MDSRLKEIIETLQKNGKKYFVTEDGVIKERITPVYSERTGYYINENGEYMKETNPLSFDQSTGVYEDEEGNIRESGILSDDKTGYYKEDNKYKKEGFFGRSYKEESYSQPSSSSDDGQSGMFIYFMYLVGISIALLVLNVAVYLAPFIFLIWYLIKERKKQWIAIVGVIFTGYLIYDISNYGFISSLTQNFINFNDFSTQKYVLIAYFVSMFTTLGFYLDKYSATKIPVVKNGNFFQEKDIQERRPLIIGLSAILLIICIIFLFV